MKTIRLNFNDAMASAIVEGRKTVTRRPVVPQPIALRGPPHPGESDAPYMWCDEDGTRWKPLYGPCHHGDLLIGRECWGWASWYDGASREGVEYRADGARVAMERGDDPNIRAGWHPSSLMPDWAARIRRTVTSVRVELLQAITDDDAVREGVGRNPVQEGTWIDYPERTSAAGWANARESFASLWNSIYAAKGLGWDTNPWVWRIEFEGVQP